MNPEVIEELDALLMKLTPEQVQVYEVLVGAGLIDGSTFGDWELGCGDAYGLAYRVVKGHWVGETDDYPTKDYDPLKYINATFGVSLTDDSMTDLESYLIDLGRLEAGSDFHKAVLAHMDGRGIIPKESN